jgi:hypothetical protein
VVPTGGNVDDCIMTSKSSKSCSLPKRDRGVETERTVIQSSSSSSPSPLCPDFNDYKDSMHAGRATHTFVDTSDDVRKASSSTFGRFKDVSDTPYKP